MGLGSESLMVEAHYPPINNMSQEEVQKESDLQALWSHVSNGTMPMERALAIVVTKKNLRAIIDWHLALDSATTHQVLIIQGPSENIKMIFDTLKIRYIGGITQKDFECDMHLGHQKVQAALTLGDHVIIDTLEADNLDTSKFYNNGAKKELVPKIVKVSADPQPEKPQPNIGSASQSDVPDDLFRDISGVDLETKEKTIKYLRGEFESVEALILIGDGDILQYMVDSMKKLGLGINFISKSWFNSSSGVESFRIMVERGEKIIIMADKYCDGNMATLYLKSTMTLYLRKPEENSSG